MRYVAEEVGDAFAVFLTLARQGESGDFALSVFLVQDHVIAFSRRLPVAVDRLRDQDFLLGCGLERHLRSEIERAPELAAERSREAQRLTLPGQMGERFRVLALARDYRNPLQGFALRDLTRTL